MSDVFLSYAREDRAFVRRLHTALADQERDSWVDWEDIPLTVDWWKAIQEGIEAAYAFVFVISPDSAQSKVCYQEVNHAALNNKRIVPILHREITETDQEHLHEAVTRHNWLEMRESDSFNEKFQDLINALDTDLAYVKLHTKLLVRAHEWDRNARRDSPLLRGEDLREAEAWLAESGSKEPKPTELHTVYILASRRAVNRFQRVVLVAVSTALIVAVSLAILAYVQFRRAEDERIEADRNAATATYAQGEALIRATAAVAAEQTAVYEAGRAQSIALAAQSQLELDGPFAERGVLLAMAALENYPYTWQAERALGLAVQAEDVPRDLTGHEQNSVSGVAWSPDGTRIVTSGLDHVAKVWDAVTGAELLTLIGHTDMIRCAAWSPDSTRILTTGDDSVTRIWDAATGNLLVDLPEPVGTVVTETALQTVTTYSPAPVWAAAWSPDGTRVVTAGMDHTAKVWDAVRGEHLFTLKGHTERLLSVAWSPDGTRIVTGSDDDTAKIWDAASGEELFTLVTYTNGGVWAVAWSPDSTRIVAGCGLLLAKMFDATTGTEMMVLAGNTGIVRDISWSPNGTRLAAACMDGTIKVWDAASGAEILILRDHTEWVNSVAWSPDGRYLVSASGDETVKIWRISQSVEDLINHAETCCMESTLDTYEIDLFGLNPDVSPAPPTFTPGPTRTPVATIAIR